MRYSFSGQSLFKDISLSLIIIIIGYFVKYAVNLLLANWLSIAEYGDFSVTMRVVEFCGALVLLGADDTALRFIPEYISAQNWGKVSGYLRRHILQIIKVGLLAVSTAALMLTVLFVWDRLHISPAHYHPAVYALCLAPIIAMMMFLSGVLRSLRKVALALIPSTVLSYVLFGIGFILLFNTWYMYGIIPFIIIFGFAMLCVIAVQISLVYYALPSETLRAYPRYEEKIWLKVGFHLMLSNLAFIGLRTLELWFLELLDKSEESVGIFSAILVIANFLWLIDSAVKVVVGPLISPIILEKRYDKLQRLISLITGAVFVPVIILAFIIVFFGKTLLSHFGPDYVSGYIPLIIVMGGISLTTAFGVTIPTLQYSGYQELVVRINVVALVLLAFLDIILIPLFGIYGASISLVVSRLWISLSAIYCVRRYLKVWPFGWWKHEETYLS